MHELIAALPDFIRRPIQTLRENREHKMLRRVAEEHETHRIELEKSEQWLREHPTALATYEGEYVAVTASGIIAHSKNFIELIELARQLNITDPLIVPVTPAQIRYISE